MSQGERPGNQPPVARTICTEFAKPYFAHALIGPSCAIARFDGSELTVWSHTQATFNLRRDLALALRLEPQQVTVQYVEGGLLWSQPGRRRRVRRRLPSPPV